MEEANNHQLHILRKKKLLSLTFLLYYFDFNFLRINKNRQNKNEFLSNFYLKKILLKRDFGLIN